MVTLAHNLFTLFSRKVPILFMLLAAVVSCMITTIIFLGIQKAPGAATTEEHNSGKIADTGSGFDVTRDSRDYKYVSPIISIEPANESERFSALKSSINEFIDREKAAGKLFSASVYVKDFSKSDWFAINPATTYFPGSLLKVGVLINYQRMAEADPKLLDKEVVYHGEKGFVFPVEHFGSDTVVEGKKYRVKQLLEHMIRNSDNRATVYLENFMDTTMFKREFADLGITSPRFNDPTYSLNVKEYSMMFKALYNGGYLRKRVSEQTLALLTECNFKEGLLKELRSGVVMAHKFGEAGSRDVHELHESGIVYLGKHRYLITVMTQGNDWDELSKVIGHISRLTYDQMSQFAH